MSGTDDFADIGVEGNGGGRRRPRRRRGSSNRGGDISLDITNEVAINDYSSSLAFIGSEDHSWAYFDSSVGSWGIYSYNHGHMVYLSEEVDLESGELEAQVHSSGNDEKRCRICHLKCEDGHDDDDDKEDEDEEDDDDDDEDDDEEDEDEDEEEEDNDGGGGDDDDEVEEDYGVAIELGCDCKGGLGTAHQRCALTWFLMKGDLTCEICGAIVQNLGFEQIEEVNNDDAEIQAPESSLTEPISESESSSNGKMFVTLVFGSMAVGYLIAWSIHMNMSH